MLDMEGFRQLELGVSQKFRTMWWKVTDAEHARGILRVEFHNRKGAEFGGAVYDYHATEAVVNEMESRAQEIGGESVGSLFHKEVVSQPEKYAYECVRKAE
jgi:hypothetical protein